MTRSQRNLRYNVVGMTSDDEWSTICNLLPSIDKPHFRRQLDHLLMLYVQATPDVEFLRAHALPDLKALLSKPVAAVKLVYDDAGAVSQERATDFDVADAYGRLAKAAVEFLSAYDEGLLRIPRPDLLSDDKTIRRIEGIAEFCSEREKSFPERSKHLHAHDPRLSVFVEGLILVWRAASGNVTAGGGPLTKFLKLMSKSAMKKSPSDDTVRGWIRAFKKNYQIRPGKFTSKIK